MVTVGGNDYWYSYNLTYSLDTTIEFEMSNNCQQIDITTKPNI